MQFFHYIFNGSFFPCLITQPVSPARKQNYNLFPISFNFNIFMFPIYRDKLSICIVFHLIFLKITLPDNALVVSYNKKNSKEA